VNWANPIFDPSQQLSGAPLAKFVHAITNATYDPLIKGYRTQLQQAQAHAQAVHDQTQQAYQNLAQYAEDAAKNTEAAYGTLASGMQGVGQQTQSALDAFLQRAENPAGQAVGTSPPGAVDQLAQNIAAAKANAAQTAQADQAYAQTVGALETARAGQTPGILASAATQKLGDLANAGLLAEQPIQTNLTNAQQKKAEAFSANLMSARQAERNYAIAAGTLGYKQQAAATAAGTAAFNQNPNAPGSPAYGRVQGAKNAAETRQQAAWNNNPNNVGSAAWSRVQEANNAQTRLAISKGKAAGSAGKPAPIATQNAILKSITQTQGRFRQLANQLQAWGYSPGDAQQKAYQALLQGRLYMPTTKNKLNAQGKSIIDSKTGRPQTVTTWGWTPITAVGDRRLLGAAYNTIVGKGLDADDINYLHSLGLTIGGKLPIAPPAATPPPLNPANPAGPMGFATG